MPALKNWGAVNWTADMPAATAMTISARRGNTPVPDGYLRSAFVPVTNGAGVLFTVKVFSTKQNSVLQMLQFHPNWKILLIAVTIHRIIRHR